jgi:hypothetical protein
LNADLDEAAIDDLKDRLAAKKETDADELKFKNDDKPASVKRVVKGKNYTGADYKGPSVFDSGQKHGKDDKEVDPDVLKSAAIKTNRRLGEDVEVDEATRVVDTVWDGKMNLSKGTPGSKVDRRDAADVVKDFRKRWRKQGLSTKHYATDANLERETGLAITKEEVEGLDERVDSPVKGTRKVASYGDAKHTAEVRYNPEYQEYSVHHYKDGKHQGEDSVSYHYDDKEDAHNTAKHEVKRSQAIKEEVEQVDEISKATLGSYVTKASKNASMIALGQMDAEHKAKKAKSPAMKDAWTRVRNNNQKRRWKREDNINKAVAKLTKEEEDRIAIIYKELQVNEAVHPHCKNCGNSLGGKDVELDKAAYCGDCGTYNKNPRGQVPHRSDFADGAEGDKYYKKHMDDHRANWAKAI